MIKIKFVSEAETGDFINHNQQLSVISSIEQDDGRYIIGLENGELIECYSEERKEIFRLKAKLS